MRTFTEELQTSIDEAARKVAEARLRGDDHGAEACRERPTFLRRVARRHGVEFPPPGSPVAPPD